MRISDWSSDVCSSDLFMGATGTLWADFVQTFLKAVLAGYALGCGSGFLVALLVDRVPFLQRGLLPLGNFVSALPIVGVAPIMVMRSEERRVGKEGVSTCRSRWSPYQ